MSAEQFVTKFAGHLRIDDSLVEGIGRRGH